MKVQQKSFIKSIVKATLLLLLCSHLVGCATDSRAQLLEKNSGQTQLQKRSYQSRAFETSDKNKTLRTTIAALQDLGFVVDKADSMLGSITATKFVNNVALKMSVTVRQRGESQTLVRANAQYGIKPLEDANSYQDFFSTLSKAMFLDAQEVSEG